MRWWDNAAIAAAVALVVVLAALWAAGVLMRVADAAQSRAQRVEPTMACLGLFGGEAPNGPSLCTPAMRLRRAEALKRVLRRRAGVQASPASRGPAPRRRRAASPAGLGAQGPEAGP